MDIPRLLLRVMSNPAFLISCFAPTILTVNFRLLRDATLWSKTNPSNAGLEEILNNPWLYAIDDWHIQFYTFLIAGFLFFMDVAFTAGSLLQGHSLGSVSKSLRNSRWSSWLGAVIAVLFTLSILHVISGNLAAVETVKLYLHPEGRFNIFGISIPPPYSPLTWWRGITAVLSVVFTYWKQKELPEIQGELKTKRRS